MKNRYRIRSDGIMHETIDGEVIIINIDKGVYYSLQGTGAYLWELLSQRPSVDALVDMAAQRFTGSRQQIHAGIEAFCDRLREEELIEVETGGAPPVSLSPGAVPGGGEFVEPVFEKYTDMEQLLLLDPIHEVEDSGWPNIK